MVYQVVQLIHLILNKKNYTLKITLTIQFIIHIPFLDIVLEVKSAIMLRVKDSPLGGGKGGGSSSSSFEELLILLTTS